MRLLLPLLLVAAPAHAALDERDLARAVARPPANARLPAALAFVDQRGARVTLGGIAGGRPLVLVFADYTCRHVCGPGLAMLGGALGGTKLAPGSDYRLAVVGLDARDSAADARAMTAHLGTGPVASAARVLRGDAATIAAAERALGYGVVHDADADQFAHDASVYVFAPDGRLTALLPELGVRAPALTAALAGAAPREASVTERIARLCYGLGAAHGRYGRAIALAMQGGALLLLAAMAALLWRRRAA